MSGSPGGGLGLRIFLCTPPPSPPHPYPPPHSTHPRLSCRERLSPWPLPSVPWDPRKAHDAGVAPVWASRALRTWSSLGAGTRSGHLVPQAYLAWPITGPQREGTCGHGSVKQILPPPGPAVGLPSLSSPPPACGSFFSFQPHPARFTPSHQSVLPRPQCRTNCSWGCQPGAPLSSNGRRALGPRDGSHGWAGAARKLHPQLAETPSDKARSMGIKRIPWRNFQQRKTCLG